MAGHASGPSETATAGVKPLRRHPYHINTLRAKHPSVTGVRPPDPDFLQHIILPLKGLLVLNVLQRYLSGHYSGKAKT